jgi:hypothetical protein
MATFPTFNPDPRWFPMPTLQQGSPFGGVLSDAIAKRLAMANTQTKEAELPYAGIAKGAQAASQLSYAANVQPQYALKAMTSSKLWPSLTPQQQEYALQLAAGPATGGGNSNPMVQEIYDIYNKQKQKRNEPSFFDRILNTITGNNSAPQQQPAQNNNVQGNGANAPQANTQSNIKTQGLPVVPPNIGDQSQAQQNEANYLAGQNQRAAEGTATGNQSAKQLDLAQKASATAQNMDQNIDSAVAQYSKSWFKGPVLGKYAKYGPDAAQALKDTNAMAIQMADSLFGAGSTDAKQATATTLKLNMEDPPRAFKQFAEKMKAQNDRIKWMGTFYQTAEGLKITNPRERDQLWFDYNAKYPPYDYQKHKPIRENLGLDQNQMQKFITQQRAENNTFNKRIMTTLNENNEEKEFVENKNKTRYAKTPEEWHAGKQAEASKMRNGKRQVKINGKWYEEE